jgi:lipid-A-disaccharide synthase
MIELFGFIAQIAFGTRFLVQWLASEKVQKSVTPPLFWHLSIVGNLLLYIHSLLTLHVPMGLMQSQNLILSIRNLNLEGPKNKQMALWHVVGLLFVSLAVTLGYFAQIKTNWIAPPNIGLHAFGVFGIICFGLRFWVQWWQAETNKEGKLSELFWWISLVGAVACSIYFFMTAEWVYFIGPFVSLVPYSRNLYFLRKA